MPKNQNNSCPECGGPAVDGLSCWDMLGIICSLEWTDPELQKEYFLTVASYNLQHPAKFEQEAMSNLRISYVDYLDRGVLPSELRRRASAAYEGSTRVLKKEGDRVIELKRWPVTISTVYESGNPVGAAERVRNWGRSVRGQLN